MTSPEVSSLTHQLTTIREKCELQSKKIKLYRKENEELKHELARQVQQDASLLLNSKELSEANSKLEAAINDISLKLQIELEHQSPEETLKIQLKNRPVALTTVKNITVTEQTVEVDLPKEEVTDQDIELLAPFKNIRSLILGENQIGEKGVRIIIGELRGLTKLILNSNRFQGEALEGIGKIEGLKVLDLRNNNLGDNCMVHLAGLKNIAELSLSKNNLTDKGVSALAPLAGLLYLDLTTNQIAGGSEDTLLTFTKLTHLYLMSNRVPASTVYKLIGLPSLEVLEVRFNINNEQEKAELKANKPQKLHFFC